MSTVPPPWSADVLDFAAKHQVAAYLEPLLEAARRAYPTARSLKVVLDFDRELRDVWCIVFQVEVPQADVPDYLEARRRWEDELLRICPRPLVPLFCLSLFRVAYERDVLGEVSWRP
jgi:hypothetical protein